MDLLDRLAEEKIAAAVEDGAFDDLPGAGQPQDLGDDALVPPELRSAYRLLKNSGFLPPELECRRELQNVEALLDRADLGTGERRRAQKRLALLQARVGESRLGQSLRSATEYERAVLDRLDGGE